METLGENKVERVRGGRAEWFKGDSRTMRNVMNIVQTGTDYWFENNRRVDRKMLEKGTRTPVHGSSEERTVQMLNQKRTTDGYDSYGFQARALPLTRLCQCSHRREAYGYDSRYMGLKPRAPRAVQM